MEQSARVIEGSMQVGGQEHFYLEGQIASCHPGEGGEMKVFSSTQHPSEVQHLVARMLGRPDAMIVCECRRMGGGFGGKESQAAQWACLCALASHVTGKPAKMRLDRDDDFITTGKRHDFDIEWRAGIDDNGVIEAVEVELCQPLRLFGGPVAGRQRPHHVPHRQLLLSIRMCGSSRIA